MHKPTGEFGRDAGERLHNAMSTTQSTDYPILVTYIVEKFSL